MRQLLRMKEQAVNPLNYSCEFSRLTQLFQRPLQIKYYVQKKDGAGSANAVKQNDGMQDEQAQYMNEEGDMIEAPINQNAAPNNDNGEGDMQ